MILQIIILTFGLALLWAGAEILIRYSSTLARSLGISPIVIGLTVVSVGTSLPEFVVSLMAAVQNTMGISIGNIIGSNIANIGLVLGCAAVLTRLRVKKSWVFKEVPAMIFFTLIFTFFSYTDLLISGIEGFVLVLFLLGFLFYLWKFSAEDIKDTIEFSEPQTILNLLPLKTKILYFFLSLLGILILIGGSHATVSAGKKIALAFGVSDTIIGLTLIAVGTSLPELATTIVGIFRKETDIVVGNVIGSNIFNLLFIGGVVPIIKNIPVEASLFGFQFPALIILSLLVWPLMRTKWNLHHLEGILLLVLYIIFIGWTF